ncbi:Pentatricopeptide repeat-containing protein [Nymphaea thermarum]|nr:Pentatricopeptide repeat-containing protein [Nymphaea thermarum]
MPFFLKYLIGISECFIFFKTQRNFTSKSNTHSDNNGNGLCSMMRELGSLCKDGLVKEAMELWASMEFHLGFHSDSATYTGLIQACVRNKSLYHGKLIHGRMIKNPFKSCLFLENNLLNMYSKCGCFSYARRLFVQMSKPNIVSWNALISGYAQSGLHVEALADFRNALMTGIFPDRYTLSSALSACGQAMDFDAGRQIHGRIVTGGFESQLFVVNSLIDMYSRCGQVDEAQNVFHGSLELDEASYNTLISGYGRTGNVDEACRILVGMLRAGLKMNSYAAGSCLNVCADSSDSAAAGKQIHASLLKTGLLSDVVVGCATLDMYAKSGSISDAEKIFNELPNRNIVAYNAMIAGTTQNLNGGTEKTALQLFLEMQRNGMKPSNFTFSSILKACVMLDAFDEGKQIHAHIIRNMLDSDEFIGSALIDLYAKAGEIGDGLKCFSSTPKQDSVSWTAAIAGSIWNGQFEEGIKLLHQMLAAGLKPDEYTVSSVLSACASLVLACLGAQVHAYTVKSGINYLTGTTNALICMYAKSGEAEKAEQLFEQTPNRDVITWSALISAHAHQGSATKAFQVFYRMKESGELPNEITFLSVLTACSHAGLVDEGFNFYKSMIREHNISPNVKHSACIVDLLGRAGKLTEAEQFISTSGFENDPAIWRVLLGACRNHGDITTGKQAAERVIELEPHASSAYVLLYNMYISKRQLAQAKEMRKLMMLRGVKKEPGLSWIDTGKQTHLFVSCDKAHPQTELIYRKLENVLERIKEMGYVDNQELLFLHDEDDQEGNTGHYHSEKLAVAFGLMSLPANVAVRVMKNLRVCGDCHSFMKFVSKSENREIVLRDCIRFHHFRGGLCSCKDYW